MLRDDLSISGPSRALFRRTILRSDVFDRRIDLLDNLSLLVLEELAAIRFNLLLSTPDLFGLVLDKVPAIRFDLFLEVAHLSRLVLKHVLQMAKIR